MVKSVTTFSDEELDWLHIACLNTRDQAFLTLGSKDHETVKKWERLMHKVSIVRAERKETQHVN